MKYLIDTDTCIYAIKHRRGVLERMLDHAPSALAVSVITEAELRTGAAKSESALRTTRLVESFLGPLTIVEFTTEDATAYAHVRARLERAGTPIGPLDTLIAAQAVSRHLMLVSNNLREFTRVKGLRVESWAT